MSKAPTLDEALAIVRKLPTKAQLVIADEMIKRAQRHRELNDELAAAEAELDAGKGLPAEDVLTELAQRYARY